MNIPDLLQYLLGRRHELQNMMIIDCLALASLEPRKGRWSWLELAKVLHASNQPQLSKKLCDLRRHGLIDYEHGDKYEPGYLIFRVGPR